MAEVELFRAHCPSCDGERVCFVHGQYKHAWVWEEGRHYAEGENDHRLLQCRGCETVFYFCGSWDSNDWEDSYHPETGERVVTHPVSVRTHPEPKSHKKSPDWLWRSGKIEPRLAMILGEMYEARKSRSFILSSIGLRTAFDRASELLGIDSELPFDSKVKELHKRGFIGESEAAVLMLVTNAGNAAAHRGWAPSEEEYEGLLLVLEHFLERNLVTGMGILKIASSIPKRPPKKPNNQPE